MIILASRTCPWSETIRFSRNGHVRCRYELFRSNCKKCCSNRMHEACGRLDAYCEHHIWSWDICAATVIVEEAGGAVIEGC